MLSKNRIFYVLIDFAAIVCSYVLAMLAKFASLQSAEFIIGRWYGAVYVTFAYLTVVMFYQSGKPLMERSLWNELKNIFLINMYIALVLAFILYLSKLGGRSSRAFYLLFFFFNYFCMVLGRLYCKYLLISHYHKPENRKKLLVYANRSNELKVMNHYVNSMPYDCDVVAVAIVEADQNSEEAKTILYLVKKDENGNYMDISTDSVAEFLKKQVVDEALISIPENSTTYLNNLICRLETLGIVAHVTVNTFGLSEREKVIDYFGRERVLTYCTRVFEPTELFLKRFVDILGGAAGIFFTVILGIFVVPAIYMESPGPVIFKQTRVGRNGRLFSIYKFRSMYMDAEERKKELMSKNQMNGLMFKLKDDPRITKVGKFIRKTSIDEFPQFFNVLKGDMSLVGTRPPTMDEFVKYEEHHKRRLSLKPGITGLWQVSGRSGIQDFEEVVSLDLNYIDNWSIWSDLRILCQTVIVVLLHKGAE